MLSGGKGPDSFSSPVSHRFRRRIISSRLGQTHMSMGAGKIDCCLGHVVEGVNQRPGWSARAGLSNLPPVSNQAVRARLRFRHQSHRTPTAYPGNRHEIPAGRPLWLFASPVLAGYGSFQGCLDPVLAVRIRRQGGWPPGGVKRGAERKDRSSHVTPRPGSCPDWAPATWLLGKRLSEGHVIVPETIGLVSTGRP